MSRYINAKHFDERVRLAVGLEGENMTDDFKDGIQATLMLLRTEPTADVVEVVRCKDCKHRIMNDHYGEVGYMELKAMCDQDTGDPFELSRCAEDDEWFCADGERSEDGGKQ